MKPTTRTRQLKVIHILKRDLRLEDAPYRRLLIVLTGQRSSATMTAQERSRVITFLERELTDERRAQHATSPVTDAEALDILGGY